MAEFADNAAILEQSAQHPIDVSVHLERNPPPRRHRILFKTQLRMRGRFKIQSAIQKMFQNLALLPRRNILLEMRPNCECCGRDLPADRDGAMICSFECTFCSDCSENNLKGLCPNCGGKLVMRPPRPSSKLLKFPASTKRIVKEEGCVGR